MNTRHEDPRINSPRNNYGAGGGFRRLVDIESPYSDETIVWQEKVYELAREVADVRGVSRVVDIGVGAGRKLVDAFDGSAASLLQVDWADNREPLPDAVRPPFLQINLEDAHDVDRLRDALDAPESTLIILSDVIEHLDDPRWLLRAIRATLRNHPDNRLILSTPDRERVDGIRSDALPDNPAHVRQWTGDEFDRMLRSGGFRIERLVRVPQNRFDEFDRTLVAEVSCDDACYDEFLLRNRLPPRSDHLVITTEHSKALRTGGIGTYYATADATSGKKRIVLYCGTVGLPEDWRSFVEESGWLHCADLAGRGSGTLEEIAGVDPCEVLDAVLLTLYLYDEIRLIEYQDYRGIGVRVAQAKRARLLPPTVFVMAYAHGNHFYLDNAASEMGRSRDIEIDVMERMSVELTDCVVFPSRFIEKLYLEKAGFAPRLHRHQPYPLLLEDREFIETDFGRIDTLVFYGKHSKQKGYFDFCDAVCELFGDQRYASSAAQVKRIVLLGSTDPDQRLLSLQGVRVECGIYSRDEVVAALGDLSPHSLVVMPYKGDNQPLSMFEVVASFNQLLAYRAGGLPEQLPDDLHQSVLCDPNAKALADAMHRCIGMSFWDRCSLIRRTREGVRELYAGHTASYVEMIESFKRLSPPPRVEKGDVSLIVANFNGTREFLEDAFLSVRNSFQIPKSVVIVDDHSGEEGFSVLKDVAEQLGSVPFEIVRNETNVGLAATRNVGLERVSTSYVCAFDNDDVLLNRFLDLAVRILDENPEVAAVTSWLSAFNDGDVWNSDRLTTLKYSYRPLGADLGLGLRANVFGGAFAVFRTEVLKDLGGWDASSRAMWEDWQLFARMTALGKQIWVIPKELFLYRVRQSSMARTYPSFDGWLRIADVIPGIPRNQRVGLLRAVLTPEAAQLSEQDAMRTELATLRDEVAQWRATADSTAARLAELEGSTIWRGTQSLRSWLSGHPRMRRWTSGGIRAMARAVRAVRRRYR